MAYRYCAVTCCYGNGGTGPYTTETLLTITLTRLPIAPRVGEYYCTGDMVCDGCCQLTYRKIFVLSSVKKSAFMWELLYSVNNCV
jgi:hypothetical protein